jgi:hypothetical protein
LDGELPETLSLPVEALRWIPPQYKGGAAEWRLNNAEVGGFRLSEEARRKLLNTAYEVDWEGCVVERDMTFRG